MTTTPNTAADGGRRHGRCHRKGRRRQRLGRFARHRQCADQRHRSRRRRHQDRHRGQLRRDQRHARHGARRRHGSLVLNASGAFTYTVNENDAAVQALRLSTNTLTDVFNYTMRDTAGATSIDDAHGHHSRRQRRAGARRPDRQPERDRRLGLLADAAGRHLHRRRCRRHAHLHGDRRLAAAHLADVQCRDTDVQRHAGGCRRRHAQRQGHGHRSRRPRRQRDLQHRRDGSAGPQGVVSLSGTSTQYQTIAANVTDVDGLLPGTPITYQWQQSSDKALRGAT